VKQLEIEKQKLNEKWLKLSARQKIEERNKSKNREKEVKIDSLMQ